MNDDAQLIDQTLGGQSAAFGQLVEKYQDRLYNTLVHVLGNAEDAKDVVQEAFVRAFLKLATFERASAFYTWLYRIALNLAATHQRQRRTARAAEQARVVDGEPARAGDGPSGRLERDECRGQVRRAVAALDEDSARSWSCGKSTGVVMKRLPKSSICPSARCAAGCTGRECNCGNS